MLMTQEMWIVRFQTSGGDVAELRVADCDLEGMLRTLRGSYADAIMMDRDKPLLSLGMVEQAEAAARAGGES